jgi:hypothetical protein
VLLSIPAFWLPHSWGSACRGSYGTGILYGRMPHHCNGTHDNRVLLYGISLNAATLFAHAYLHQPLPHYVLAAPAARWHAQLYKIT